MGGTQVRSSPINPGRFSVAREYFYAYDRTGGSSGPGIKAFVHDKIAALEKTEEPGLKSGALR